MLGIIYVSKIKGKIAWAIDIYNGKYCVDTIICNYKAEAIEYCKKKKWRYMVITGLDD